MKSILITFLCHSFFWVAQSQIPTSDFKKDSQTLESLTQEAAIKGLTYANAIAKEANKKIAVAFLDASGKPILITIADGVGPHNLEAARRKAFTALSTKTPTLILARNASANPDTQNLNTLPELLLLGGGVPIIVNNKVIGSVGIAGAGGPEQDDAIAQKIETLFQ
ncbi:MAG: heme-binding protein [Flavobacterium sp.]|uniref:GlcG/HbpS family heme-binding protein n=1 Tax=Flavobacterium sp. TaxID=239 RepID=UPI001B79F075|nr:heme-binding protein [Flavobacterium sp.]MBP7183691.1 heme-binding protein [Flavobacterium sp.]